MKSAKVTQTTFRYGWAEVDITPAKPVFIAGQFHARRSEGVMDPITATVWAVESNGDQVLFVTCDLSVISNELRVAIRQRLEHNDMGLDVGKIVISSTHTHTGPQNRAHLSPAVSDNKAGIVGLEAMPVLEYVEFAADRIAAAARKAWTTRADGGVAYGAGEAVIGRNRRWVNSQGQATMYRLNPDVTHTFEHIEGYEDHNLQVLATYNSEGELDGLVINIPCPSQTSEQLYVLSADYWHETRLELRKRFGEHLHILPQCSAAGDQSPHLIWNKGSMERMLKLKGRTLRDEIAQRIANAVEDLLPYIQPTIDTNPAFHHQVEQVHLPVNPISEEDALAAAAERVHWQSQLDEERRKLAAHPEIREQPHWYVPVTRTWSQVNRFARVQERYEEQQKGNHHFPVDIHVIRLGEIVFATNPFELYLDFGVQVKVQSGFIPHVFLIQLCEGQGTYLSTQRAVDAGGYGSVIAGSPIGPEGGKQLVEHTVRMIKQLWSAEEKGEAWS